MFLEKALQKSIVTDGDFDTRFILVGVIIKRY